MDGIPDCQKSEFVHGANQPIGIERRCQKCKKIKSITEFYNDKSKCLGKSYRCKLCQNETNKIWKSKNPKFMRESAYKWRRNNQEKFKEIKEKWKAEHPGRISENCRKWRTRNPEKAKEIAKRAYLKQNSTIKGKLSARMKNATKRLLTKGSKAKRHWEDLIGYPIEMFIKHIENQFVDGMAWENYGKWHIDHKIPISAFNFTTPDDIDFKKCWSLKNLQPLWSKKNQSKNNRLCEPFQPSLTL